jgi:hypothetical protein
MRTSLPEVRRPPMERIACIVQLNRELLTDQRLRLWVLSELGPILHAAAGDRPVAVVRVDDDRFVAQVSREAFEEVTLARCPRVLREQLVAVFDARV